MSRLGRGRAPLLALLAVLLAPPAGAHPLAPSLLRLVEGEGGRVEVLFRTPTTRQIGAELRPRLPEACRPVREASTTLSADRAALVTRWAVDCGAPGLVGREVRVEGLRTSSTNVVVEVIGREGATARALLHQGEPSFVVPATQGRGAVFVDYLRLGVEHLLTGPDHVLFVLGLLLVIVSLRRLASAITAFTLGHSVSLALAALGLVRVPQAPVEVAIAVTLIVLALDILRAHRAMSPGPVARYPWLVCSAFGLLHGLGFAGALAHTGLPAQAIPLSLFSFNLGIEVGQLSIVAAALVGWALARRLLFAGWAPSRLIPAYLIGSLAAFWVLERGLGGLGLIAP